MIASLASPGSITMRERLIVALDVSSAQDAQALVSGIGDAAGIYKVGLQLFTAQGPNLVREFVSSGRKVFLDLKLHDIPNTVGKAVKSAADLGVSMLTVHASGGSDVLRAAVEAAGPRLAILGVTVLTSFDDADLVEIGLSNPVPGQVVRLDDDDADLLEIGLSNPVPRQVVRLAELARRAGCAGVVTSPRETAQVRRSLGEGFAIVNPGVRPAGTSKDDQERTATPAEAIRAGATLIVVGRPITQAKNPARAAHEIVQEMEQAESSGVR